MFLKKEKTEMDDFERKFFGSKEQYFQYFRKIMGKSFNG